MSKQVLILCGSPRENGNSDRLADAFGEGATAAGHQVRKVRVADLKIGGCRACKHCFDKPGKCVQDDDMISVLKAFREAHVVVFASPVYWFGVTAQLKAAIDRTYSQIPLSNANKKAVVLMTCEDADYHVADPALKMFRMMFDYSGWEEAGSIVVPGTDEAGAIAGRTELDRARELGERV